MTLPSEVNQIDEIAVGVDHFLKAVDPAPFSAPAFSVLKGKVTQYVSDLVTESDAVRKRDKADSVSVKHVEIASEHLILKSRNKVYKLAGTIGGIAFGTSVSTLCAMTLVWQFPPAGIVICTSSGMVGGFLLAVSLMKD
jgi:hypothetical protein